MPLDLRDGDGAADPAIARISLDGWNLTWSSWPPLEPPAPPSNLALVQIVPDGAAFRVMIGFTPSPHMEADPTQPPLSGYLARVTPADRPSVTHYLNVPPEAQGFEVRHLLPGRYQVCLQSRINLLGEPTLYSTPSAALDFVLGEELGLLQIADCGMRNDTDFNPQSALPTPQSPAPAPAGGGWWCRACRAFVEVSDWQAVDGAGALCFTCGSYATVWRDG